jgi:Flp pilus assembly protein TadB
MDPKMVGPMFTTTLGNIMITTVIVMILFAAFLIKKIINIDI